MIKSEKILLSKELADVRDEYPKLRSVSVESSYPRSPIGSVLELLMCSTCLEQLEASLIRFTFLSWCCSLFLCPQRRLKDISVHLDDLQCGAGVEYPNQVAI